MTIQVRRLMIVIALFGAGRLSRADVTSTSQPYRNGTGTYYNYNTYRIPAMVVSNQGTIIVAADGRVSSSGDVPAAIDCVIRRSTDNGNTWSDQIIAANYGTNTSDTDLYPLFSTTTAQTRTSASDPSLLVDRTGNGADVPAGRIWVFYDNGSSASYNGYGRTIKLEMRYSDDDGVTWSDRYDVEAVNASLRPKTTETYAFNGSNYTYGTGEFIVGPGNGIQIEAGAQAGRLVFPVYWYRTNNCSLFIYSDDHGKTWKRGGVCGKGTGEVQMVELTDGSLMASMRPSGVTPTGYRYFTKSTDSGTTWTTVGSGSTSGGMTYFTGVPDPACQGNIFRLSTTADSASGRRLASDKNRLVHANAASTSSRVNMTVRMSYDEGQSWTNSVVVYTSAAAYSSLTRLANGDIGLLYEKDSYATIDFVRLTIPQVNSLDAQPAYNLWANGTFTLAQLMDPAISGSSADPDGNGYTNLQEFQARPSASIAVTTPLAYEAGANTNLEFQVTLSAANLTDSVVNLSYGGTATSGVDYVGPASITIPAGQTQGTVTVGALDDAVTDPGETVIVTVLDGTYVTQGSPSSATGSIDEIAVPGVTIVATDATASEPGSDTGTFTIQRDDPAAAATVAYTVSGTATLNSDYTALAGTVDFAAGQATATLTVIPLDDELYERTNETVVVTLSAGTGYTVGSPSAATVTISSDEPNPRKANNSLALNLAGSWMGDAPLSTETPAWDNLLTGSVATDLGAATTWAGITDSCTNGVVTLSGAYTLAAGAVTVNRGASLVITNSISTLSLSSLSGEGILTINKSGTADMSTSLNSANAIQFSGTLRLRGGTDGSWIVLGGSSTTQAAGTKFHLDTGASSTDKRELVMGNAWDGKTLTLASLTGYGKIRCDWGTGASCQEPRRALHGGCEHDPAAAE